MSKDISHVAKILVDNLQRSRTPRIVEEVVGQQLLQWPTPDEKTTGKESPLYLEQAFRENKKHLLSAAFPEASQIDWILNLPDWIGFKPLKPHPGENRETLYRKSRDAVASTLWLMSIPRNMIGSAADPDELRKESIDLLMRNLIESDESRDLFVSTVRAEMEERGIDSGTFDVRHVLSGYGTEDPTIMRRTPAAFSLILIASTSLPFDLDCLLRQSTNQLVRVTAAFTVVFHVMRHLRQLISGDARSKPFEWPMVGDKKVVGRVSAALNLLETMSAEARCCTLFAGDETAQHAPAAQKVVSVFLEQLIDNYANSFKNRRGKAPTEDLANFIEALRAQRYEISKRVTESPDRGSALLTELLIARNKSKGTPRRPVSPEKTYAESLSLLEGRLKVGARGEGFDVALVDELRPIFDSMVQIMRENKDRVGEDAEPLAEAMCFETCFKILDFLGLGQYIMDLSWVSRFIAEQCRRVQQALTSSEKVSANRSDRIVTAYEAGLIYLILQTRKSESA